MPKKKSENDGRQVPRLIGYARVSTEEQAREGVSLGAQQERLRAYVVAHEAELVGLEVDAGISGKVGPCGRPGLARVLAALRDGEADGLLVLKLDRLSRSTRDVLDLVDESRRQGWRLVSVGEHLDTGSAAGRLVVTVLAALSEMEREQIGERTRFAMHAIAREGRGRSRLTPYGWRTADGEAELREGDRRELKPHEGEQAILRRMVALRASGLGALRIARELGTNPRMGRPWNRGGVASVLATLDRRADAFADHAGEGLL